MEGYDLPVLVLRGIVILPGSTVHFDLERDRTKRSARAAMAGDGEVIMVTQISASVTDPTMKDLFSHGVRARVIQLTDRHNGLLHVTVAALERIVLKAFSLKDGYYYAAAEDAPLDESGTDDEREALIREVQGSYMEYLQALPKMPADFAINSVLERDPKRLICAICDTVTMDYTAKQMVLEASSILEQLFMLNVLLQRELRVLQIQRSVADKVQKSIEEHNREHYIREQIRALQEELPDGAPEDSMSDYEEFRKKVEEIKNISPDGKEKLLAECERFARTINFPQEAAVSREYLETALSVPWDSATKDRIDLSRAKKQLDKDHYGLTDVKKRILELLAVRKLSPDIKGQIICLVGPPGIGKTSIAGSVAKTMGRKFVRVSLGGVRDEADIRGHRKTYLGSMPGRIINALIEAKSMNPLILLDEIDKMGNDFRGDPASAMLEVLDAEQNVNFRDHYLEVGVDLSKVLFVTTANNLNGVPAPLRDRMEIIELSSYTREEKYNIAKKHLLPKQMAVHALTPKQLTIQKPALYDIIDSYTKEAGVRNLERTLAAICRKAAVGLVEAKEAAEREDGSEEKESAYKLTVTMRNLETLLGPRLFLEGAQSKEDQVGVVNGLAWTAVGGEILEIEVAVLEGTGQLKLTGSLGDVMKESAQLAISYARSVSEKYGIDPEFYRKKDIHLHAPEGAVPKDGPSAGVTMTTALISALCGRRVRHDIAMTGEISLLGKVLPIGGLREKSMAAYKARMKAVCIPEGNLPDLAKIDAVVKESVEFIPCRRIEDVIDAAMMK